MIRVRAVFRIADEVAKQVQWLLENGAIAIEIDYDPEEP